MERVVTCMHCGREVPRPKAPYGIHRCVNGSLWPVRLSDWQDAYPIEVWRDLFAKRPTLT